MELFMVNSNVLTLNFLLSNGCLIETFQRNECISYDERALCMNFYDTTPFYGRLVMAHADLQILGLKRVSFQNTDLFLSKTNRFLALTYGYQIIVINYIFNRVGVCQNALRYIEFEGKDDVISRIDSGTFPANEDEMVNGAARKSS